MAQTQDLRMEPLPHVEEEPEPEAPEEGAPDSEGGEPNA